MSSHKSATDLKGLYQAETVAGGNNRGGFLSLQMLKRVDTLILQLKQATGEDLATTLGLALPKFLCYAKLLRSFGRAHCLMSTRYRGGLWMPGVRQSEELGGVEIRVTLRHWDPVPFRVDVAEALLFNRHADLILALAMSGAETLPSNIRFVP